ncbi:MAG: hypothetical protein KDB31_02640, partial [Microthrixaceae bacterium]|nr:hypothetical protein [Microthrixaceae bacterium]
MPPSPPNDPLGRQRLSGFVAPPQRRCVPLQGPDESPSSSRGDRNREHRPACDPPIRRRPVTARDLDQIAIATLRFLAVDQVEAAKSGHPGAPLGLAPAAHVLWSRF